MFKNAQNTLSWLAIISWRSIDQLTISWLSRVGARPGPEVWQPLAGSVPRSPRWTCPWSQARRLGWRWRLNIWFPFPLLARNSQYFGALCVLYSNESMMSRKWGNGSLRLIGFGRFVIRMLLWIEISILLFFLHLEQDRRRKRESMGMVKGLS